MSSHHVVHFYGADRNALINHLGRYAANGLDAGEAVVIIANRDLHDAIFDVLQRLRAEPDFGAEDGRLMVADSLALVDELFIDGHVDPNRFDRIIGRMLRETVARSRSHNVRVFGDMVDALWRRGQRAQAVELERYWNDLQAQLPFDLYCAYDIDVFSEEFRADTISPVISQHSQVVQAGSASLNGALDYAAYETLGRTCPPLPDAEATILWLRANEPDRAPEILKRAKEYAGG